MSLKMGNVLKENGLKLAAKNRSLTLRLCREHLYELAQTQETVTADDAQAYVESAGLSPLGNAAGHLFSEKHWEFVGWEKSARTSNHNHQNRCWRLKGDKPKPVERKPLSAASAKRELDSLEWLYENTGITHEAYELAKAKILADLEKWSKEK